MKPSRYRLLFLSLATALPVLLVSCNSIEEERIEDRIDRQNDRIEDRAERRRRRAETEDRRYEDWFNRIMGRPKGA